MGEQRTHVGLRRVVHAEVIKLWSLRSSWVVGSALVAVIVLLAAALVVLITAGVEPQVAAADDAVTDALVRSLTAGVFLAAPALGCLGVVVAAREFERRTVLSAFVAVPRRHLLLTGKVVSTGATAAVVVVVGCGSAWLVARGLAPALMPDLGSADVARPLVGAVLFTTWAAVAGVLIGWATRSTAAGVLGVLLILAVLPGLAVLLPVDVGGRLTSFLPGVAGRELMLLDASSGLTEVGGRLGVLVAWCAVLGAAAWWSGARRDA